MAESERGWVAPNRRGAGERCWNRDNPDDPMDVVRHDDERVQFDFRALDRGLRPCFLDGAAALVDLHLPIDHTPNRTVLSCVTMVMKYAPPDV
jgi:hypothetical protein